MGSVLYGELSLGDIPDKASRDALRRAARDAADGQDVWILNRAGERIAAIVSVEQAASRPDA